MKRNLKLIKLILLKIEEQYENIPIFNLKINGYNMQQIANHCELLFEERLISNYKGFYGGGQLETFFVGNLTNEGFNYLDSIRNTDDLESHKNFKIVYNIENNSTNIMANKINAKNSSLGNANNQMIRKETDIKNETKFPDLKI